MAIKTLHIDSMETPLAFQLVASSKLCLRALDQLSSSLEVAENKHKSHMPPQTLKNQRDRFKIWAGNLGALQEGRASLDFRLHESTLMKSAVHKLLEQLEKTTTKSMSDSAGCDDDMALTVCNRYRSGSRFQKAIRKIFDFGRQTGRLVERFRQRQQLR
ncbi:hypothetical protein LZ31DRAFT_316858 [Colletotrichum somersetense]|nr:hypothetical protein LZ31DRAFT_316858 [Colletotrichum somersetense]